MKIQFIFSYEFSRFINYFYRACYHDLRKVEGSRPDAVARNLKFFCFRTLCYLYHPSVQHSRPLHFHQWKILFYQLWKSRDSCNAFVSCYFMARHVNGKLQFLLRLHLSLLPAGSLEKKAFDGKKCAFVLLHIYSLSSLASPLLSMASKVWSK